MPTPSSTVYVQAGTAAQNSLIQAAHLTAINACQSAQAGTSGASFAPWFGAASATAIAAKLGVAATAFQNMTFAYDLKARLLEGDPSPGCSVLMEAETLTAVNVHISGTLLDEALVDSTLASRRLVLSIVHEMLRLTDSTLNDLIGTFEPAGAQLLAATDSTNATLSLQNYLGFVATFLPSNARTAAPAGKTNAASAQPRTLESKEYDAQGAITALRSTDFSGVEFDPSGRITGGSYQALAKTPEGIKTTQATVQVVQNGFPANVAAIQFANGQVVRRIQAIYTNLLFSDDMRIIGGYITSIAANPKERSEMHSKVSFSEKGDLAEVSTTRSIAGMAASTGTTNYTQVTFDADHKPIKGTATTVVKRPDGTCRSQTENSFLGQLGTAIHTQRFAADGSTTTGEIVLTRRADKTLSAADSILYRFGVPSQGTAVSFDLDGRTATGIAKTDFSQASFAPGGRQQVGGVIVTVVTRPNGSMSARLETTFAQGLFVTTTENFAADGKTLTTIGLTASRPDGTLAMKRAFAFDRAGILQTADRQSYDVDGLSVLRSTQTDFTGAVLDSQGYILSGKVVTKTLRPDNTIKSQTTIRYN